MSIEDGLQKDSLCLILLGGMTDGPLSLSYTEALQSLCHTSLHVRLILPFLHTSYRHFGLYTLEQDIQDLFNLMHFLSNEHYAQENSRMKFILMGHSTGCQIALATAKKFMDLKENSHRDLNFEILAMILQGAVSDRQFMEASAPSMQAFQEYILLSEEMRRTGRGTHFMPKDTYFVPIIADRYYSLAAYGYSETSFS